MNVQLNWLLSFAATFNVKDFPGLITCFLTSLPSKKENYFISFYQMKRNKTKSLIDTIASIVLHSFKEGTIHLPLKTGVILLLFYHKF